MINIYYEFALTSVGIAKKDVVCGQKISWGHISFWEVYGSVHMTVLLWKLDEVLRGFWKCGRDKSTIVRVQTGHPASRIDKKIKITLPALPIKE